MKAAYFTGNQQFEVKEATQLPPGPHEVRLRVAYCGVCGTDVHIYHGAMAQRLHLPQVIGHEVSAEVDAVGSEVSGVKVGDRVTVRPLQFGPPHPSDNGQAHVGRNLKFIGIDTAGGMQAYWNVPAYALHQLPGNVPLDLGAMCEPLAVACHDVRLGRVQPGEYAVVIGGGPIGVLIALAARAKGAHVLVSEPNPYRILLCQDLGLEVVNPLAEDLEKAVDTFTQSAMADVVFEVSGVAAGVKAMTQLPRARGRIVMVAIHPEPRPVDLFRFFWRELELIGARVYEQQDFEEAIRLIATDQLPLRKLITQVAPLAEVQQIFATIDQNPAGMKYLLACQ
ncbi:MAG: alcohol dehydrogenase catalytic domain-containing protein [Bernardetiaceae bacterium]|jgi:2-desacetyl-2-hydroxyethyl bacteriochlorophyllide A dehydrogenase|nr:alcohol dehydrogenase catalytic domain-containing protein [Bernardetiaceae bacterium]